MTCPHGQDWHGHCGVCQDWAATRDQKPDPASPSLDTDLAWVPAIDPGVYAAYQRRVAALVKASGAVDADTLIDALGVEESNT